VTDRRTFLHALAAATAGALPRLVPGAPAVDATPTIFHGHPDGLRTLVRFTASGIDAPAGRLRLVDRAGRLLGTAGMIRRGDALVGELWVPLATATTVRSQLETPATRGVLQTTHDLRPTPRWTLVWLAIVDPLTARARLAAVAPLTRGAAAAALVAAGVRINPWSPPPTGGRDHLDLLRVAAPAADAFAHTGVPTSRIALVPPEETDEPLRRALAGADAEVAIPRTVLTDPTVLAFAEGRARMTARVEEWLLGLRFAAAETGTYVIVVGTEDPDVAARARPAIEEWTATYAYPRIVTGTDAARQAARAVVPAPGPGDVLTQGPAPAVAVAPPSAEAVFAPFLALAAPADPTLDATVARMQFPVSGLVVFNPSPFARSDVVVLPDGSARIVTDVPGLGYAFLPDDPTANRGWKRRGGQAVATARWRVALDREGGAIRSLVHETTGRDLVRAGGKLNALDYALVTDGWVETLAGVGARVGVRRITPQGAVISTVTAYDTLPWVDIENVPEEAFDRGLDVRHQLARVGARVRWEVPGGEREASIPVRRARPLRWLAFPGDGPTLLVSQTGAHDVTVTDPGDVVLRSPAGASRVRLALHEGHLLPDDPWRFGYTILPLHGVPASGRGDRTLPTFGRLVDVADPAVAVVGLKPADDGVGLAVYFMDLGGPSREVAVRPGLLAFDGAVLTDLVERDHRAAVMTPDGAALVPVEASGYAAVRLLGVRLAT